MTEPAVRHPEPDQDYMTISLPEALAQENAQLRQQLADLERQLAAMHARVDQLVDEQVAELATLQDVDLEIHAQLDREYVMNAVLEWAMLVTSAVAGTLYLLTDPHQPAQEPKMLHAVAQQGYWPQIEGYESHRWPTGHDILARALETGQAVRQASIHQDIARSVPQAQERAHLAIPIQHQGTPIGVFGLESAFVDGFNSAQIDSAMHLADHAALAIQNALDHQQTRHEIDRLLAVHQACLSMTTHLDLATLPEQVVERALTILGAERAVVYQYDSTARTFSRAAGLSQNNSQHPETEPSERRLIEAVAQNATAQFAHDPPAGETIALPLTASPLHTDGANTGQTVQGILYLSFGACGDLSPEKQSTIHLFADYASSAFWNAQQARESLRAYQARMVNTSRTPLTAIQGYAKLMLQQIGGQITDPQREFLETILRNALSLEASIGDPSA